jgi:hypothetical protein
MFQLSHSKLRVVEAGTSPISKEEKILIFCWVLQVGVMEDEECMVRNCLKGLGYCLSQTFQIDKRSFRNRTMVLKI